MLAPGSGGRAPCRHAARQALAALAPAVLVVDGALGAALGALADEAAGDGVAVDAAGTVDFDDERASVR